MAVLNDHPELKFCKHVSYICMKLDYCINAENHYKHILYICFIKKVFSCICSYTVVMIYYIVFCIAQGPVGLC